MAYNQLTQCDVDASSVPADLDPSGSPAESHSAFPPLSPDMGITKNQSNSEIVEPPITRSREGSIPMRHPTPGLESLQGAYTSNVVRLEQSAERLSLSSDIGEEIRKMRLEQQRSDSRRSSIQQTQSEELFSAASLNRQLSYGHRSHASHSIVETNSVARSGGFSPAAFFVSPRGSIKSGSWSNHNSVKGRSASRGPRLTQVTEPEQEGKPLDSPLSTRFAPAMPPLPSPTRAFEVTSGPDSDPEAIEIPMTQSPEPEQQRVGEPAEEEEQPRASQDTYRQAMGLFSDFDGTHTEDPSLEPPPSSQPPLDRNRSQELLSQLPTVPRTPQDDMVYYPAPVPMMLNLPKRLSRLPAAPKRAQRQTQLIDSLAQDARKSAAWLPEIPQISDDNHDGVAADDAHISSQPHNHRTMANLPPQLRASMFFDHPAARQDVAIKGESAVATLDSILDASAFAPVSAFTDHPIAGRVGADIYGRTKERSRTSIVPVELEEKRKRRSSINNLLKRSSTSDLLNETEKRKSSMLGLGNFNKRKSSSHQLGDALEHRDPKAANSHAGAAHAHDEDVPPEQGVDYGEDGENFDIAENVQEDEGLQEHLEEGEDTFTGAPTTLLAELQMRKQQQKKRTRTAATAFPDGMQSTLLQLDAVAQLEKQNRFKKHTTLAWEEPDDQPMGMQDEDDEDVPLGMLYPPHQMDDREKARRLQEARPLGLIARRELEDNEPLSHRRARLRGEPSVRNSSMIQRGTPYALDFSNLQNQDQPQAQSDDEDGDETLAQRRARMKATQIPVATRRVSTDFASEILTQFGGLEPSPLPPDSPDPVKRTNTKTPDLDGVEETLGQRRKRLQAEAAARNVRSEGNNAASVARPLLGTRRSMADILQAHPAAGAGMRGVSNEFKYAPPPNSRNTAWAANVNRQASLGGAVGGAGPLYGYAGGYGGMATGQAPPVQVDARQRDMIDRWRQSVMY